VITCDTVKRYRLYIVFISSDQFAALLGYNWSTSFYIRYFDHSKLEWYLQNCYQLLLDYCYW